MADCLDPNRPEVDNEALECSELISSTCIVSTEADTYLRYGRGATLTNILGSISRAIKKTNYTLRDYLCTYQSYVVVLQQLDINAPNEIEVMDSRAGFSPVYTKTAVGEYTLTATGAFPLEKTVVLSPNSRVAIAGTIVTEDTFYAERIDDNTITIKTARSTGALPILMDNLLDGIHTTLEIRIYK